MNDRDFGSAHEQEFDAMLERDLSELLPPDDVVNDITPWRKAMNRVLTGLALSSITLNFLCLNYLLPAIGIVLLLLGFRTLRKENPWFRACWVLSLIRAAYFFPTLVINTTIWQGEIYQLPAVSALAYLNIFIVFLLMILLWGGFRAVQQKAGLPRRAGAAVGLLIWYAALYALALIAYSGLFLMVLMLVAYGLLLRSLYKLSAELDESGYTIRAAPVHLSDRVLVYGILIVLAVGFCTGYLGFRQYPMKWSVVTDTEHSDLEAIKTNLTALGFPEEILSDLSEEDIFACAGALRVVVDQKDLPANEGREVTERTDGGTYVRTVYDVNELRITGIAVELPGAHETWKIFHHFSWTVPPGFYGTEALQLWPAYRRDLGWAQGGAWSGRVLYDDRDETTYWAPYYSLGSSTYQQDSFFFGTQTTTDVFAAFSFPRGGSHYRGYLSYQVLETSADYIIDSWVNYVHQRSWFQYPIHTAVDHQKTAGILSSQRVFFLIQGALQFYPSDPVPAPF